MKARPLTSYFVLAYAMSWLVWAPAVLARFGWAPPLPPRYLHLLGGFGPMLAALIISARLGGVRALGKLARSCVRGGAWLAIGVAIPAAVFFVALAILVVATGATPDWSMLGRSQELPELSPLWAVLANVVCYGFGEEIGWRGFALPRLQADHSALRASLLLTLGWAGWHLPLFCFAAGLSHMGVGSIAGWLVSLALGSMLLTWLFNSSGGSLGAVALLHAALDVFTTAPVLDNPLLPNVIGATLSIGTLLLLPMYGPESLAHGARIVERTARAPLRA